MPEFPSRPTEMHYVYLLRSHSAPAQTYIGYSTDLRTRLATHNRGGSPHTAKHLPWRLDAYFAFTTKTRALAFEQYLKSHSGKAFATKRLWTPGTYSSGHAPTLRPASRARSVSQRWA